MSADTIDCTNLLAITRAFMPNDDKTRQGLEAAVRMYGAHRFDEGRKSAFGAAVRELCRPRGPFAALRDLIVAAETGQIPATDIG